jgi:hypothetical protein
LRACHGANLRYVVHGIILSLRAAIIKGRADRQSSQNRDVDALGPTPQPP